MNWWNELNQLQQILAYIAIPSTMVMLFQFVMTLLGLSQTESADGGLDGSSDFADGSTEIEFDDGSLSDTFGEYADDIFESHEDMADHDGIDHGQGTDVLKLLTLRGIIAFLTVGSWMGIVAIEWEISTAGALVLAFVAGWAALYFVAWSIRTALSLQHSGNINIDNAVGNIAEVYIPIPPLKAGRGKIQVVVQDRLTEFDAVTSIERTLKTGEKVSVMGVESKGVLLVVPKDYIP